MSRREGIASNEAAQARRKNHLDMLERQRAEGLRDLVATPFGRSFVWWLIHDDMACRLTGASDTPHHEGRRYIGRLLVEMWHRLSPHTWLQACAEAQHAANADNANQQAALAAAEESADA